MVNTYDDSDNVIKVTMKKNDGAPEVVLKTMTYDLADRKTSETDGNGNLTTTTYSGLNKPRTITTPGDDTIKSATVTFQYDGRGNLKNSLDTAGKLAQFTYDNQDHLLLYKEMKSGGTEVITKSAAFDKGGNKRFETDARGSVKENVYDALNRLVQTKVTTKGVEKATQYGFDANGNPTTITDWLGNTSTNVYDPLNRIVEKKDPYTTIQKLSYNEASLQSTSVDALGRTTAYEYDENNRLISTTDPEGHSTKQAYDDEGNLSAKTDGKGTVLTYVYDDMNRLIEVRNAKGEITSYTYDWGGNKLTQTDGAGHVTTYDYNCQNKLKRKVAPGGKAGSPDAPVYLAEKTETYTYHPDGTLKTKTDALGRVTNYTYDIHGRLTKKAIGNISIGYTYDGNSNITTMTDATGTTERTYDEENRVISKTVPVIGKSVYTYDTKEDGGTYSEITTDPRGNTTKKTFDKAARLIGVADGANTTTYSYQADGKRQLVLYPSGAKEVYSYYSDGQVKTLTNTKPDGSTLDAYSYTYDSAHNQTSKTDGRGVTKYDYDPLNRLSKVTEPARNGQPEKITSYLFDAAGNRSQQIVIQGTTCSAITYTYDEQNRLVKTLENSGDTRTLENYDYDAAGNLRVKVKENVKTATAGIGAVFSDPIKAGEGKNDDIAFYSYDVWNNLTYSIQGDKTAKYAYNGDGYRTEKTVNGKTTNYLYEGDKVVLETNEAGSQQARNIYGTNLLSRKVEDQTLYYMYNAHGDVTGLIDSAGATKGTYYYDAFGNVVEDTTNGLNNPILYAGYQYDKESGLYYLNARHYDPVTARFMQEDTYLGDSSDPLSLNLYAYCYNEPVMYDDPTGHQNEVGGGTNKKPTNKPQPKGFDVYKADKAVDKGIVKGVNASLEGTKQVVLHPVKTAQALGRGISLVGRAIAGDPVANKTLNNLDSQIKQQTKNTVKTFNQGDIYQKLEMGGTAVGYMGATAVTGGAAKGLVSGTVKTSAIGLKKASNLMKLESTVQTSSSSMKYNLQLFAEGNSAANAVELGDNLTNALKYRTYIRDIEVKTGRKIPMNQIRELKNELKVSDFSKPLNESAYKANTAEYNKLRSLMRDEWSENTYQDWPKYDEPVYSRNGEIYLDAGDNYDLHHIIERKYGGPNTWWNSHPASNPLEHQGGIHGKGSVANELFPR